MHSKRFARSTALIAAIGALALGTASTSAAHETSVRWVQLNPGTSSSAYTLSYTHGSHSLTMYAYFGSVTTTRIYLDRLTFRYTNVDPQCIFGGRAYIWNSSLQLTLNADRDRTYCGTSYYTLQVDRNFYGGQSNGRASVTVQKNSVDAYWTEGQAHHSKAVFYVP